MVKNYNVEIPIAGSLHFEDVSAENKEAAISKCFAMLSEAINNDLDPFEEFEGDWEMMEHITQGNVCYAPCAHVTAQES